MCCERLLRSARGTSKPGVEECAHGQHSLPAPGLKESVRTLWMCRSIVEASCKPRLPTLIKSAFKLSLPAALISAATSPLIQPEQEKASAAACWIHQRAFFLFPWPRASWQNDFQQDASEPLDINLERLSDVLFSVF